MTDAMQQTKLSLQYDLQLRKTCALIGVEPQKTIGITMRNTLPMDFNERKFYISFKSLNSILLADGNCLYDALVKATGIGIDHLSMREKICEFLLRLPGKLKV